MSTSAGCGHAVALGYVREVPKPANLEPRFQRQSVWTERDRAILIDSILRNLPLPAIFLYRRQDEGELIFDVIDGKQRLESIFMFTGAMRGRYWTRTQLPNSESPEWVDWSFLKRKGLHHRIVGYEIPVVEVDGEMGDIINVFIRINSTGKAVLAQKCNRARNRFTIKDWNANFHQPNGTLVQLV